MECGAPLTTYSSRQLTHTVLNQWYVFRQVIFSPFATAHLVYVQQIGEGDVIIICGQIASFCQPLYPTRHLL